MTSAAEMREGCPECAGTGLVYSGIAGDRVARPCRCRVEARARARLDSAGIPRRYLGCTLENFETGLAGLRRARDVADQVLCDLQSGGDLRRGRGLVLTGNCGTGKTHLAVALLHCLIADYGLTGSFAEFTDLLRRIQEGYDRRAQSTSFGVLQPILETDVLLLDDLGSMRVTDWVRDTLGLIVNERYSAQRITLITTNLPRRVAADSKQETLADRVGERVVSRLEEMCYFVDLVGPDFRRDTGKRANSSFEQA